MKRQTKGETVEVKLQTLGAMVARINLANRMGLQSYGGDRNLTQALGYLDTIVYEDYLARYCRQDIAKAIIDRPVKATWQGELKLIESKYDTKTPFEKAWVALNTKLGLKSKFSRVDRLAGIGRYGVLFLGLGDTAKVENFANPVTSKSNVLKYVMPFGEGSAKISKWEDDPNNPRYGLPVQYDITISDATNGNRNTIMVHYTRIVHIVNDPLESEIEGAPCLEDVFNRLMDLEKIVGGDAEMFWRNARPGYQGKLDKDFKLTTAVKEDLINQIDEYEHNLRRILLNEGITYDALTQAIADPKNHVDIQIAMISAVKGIPKRILMGSERGELASSQDADEWKTYVQNRREDHAEPHIINPFTNRCIELGILPKPSTGKYMVDWSDLFAMSEKERVEVGKGRAVATRDYIMNPMAEMIVPPRAFRKFYLGFSDVQNDAIEKLVETEMKEEQLSQLENPDDSADTTQENKTQQTDKTEKPQSKTVVRKTK